ncbi:MAG: DUF2950 family protein [Burkholderiaceae bacterium]|nr:DUF2950 family protein [Burkholderiaceae bacterium]
MKLEIHKSGPKPGLLPALLLAAALALPGAALAQVPFASAEAAADAFVDALAKKDQPAMKRLLGPTWQELIPPTALAGDNARLFVQKAGESRKVQVDGQRGELVVGADAWPLPIPLQQGSDGQWRFDPSGGRQALLERHIGNNELSAMQAVLAYLDAQRDYALADRNGDGLLEYAQKFVSRPGKRDGLIWDPKLGDESPLGPAFAPAKPGLGYHGYRFRILTGQGPAAPGGARSYMIGPRLVSGFAVIAWPVKYGSSGVMSFIANQAGTIYERDLGPGTAEAVAAIKVFDPAEGWQPVKP